MVRLYVVPSTREAENPSVLHSCVLEKHQCLRSNAHSSDQKQSSIYCSDQPRKFRWLSEPAPHAAHLLPSEDCLTLVDNGTCRQPGIYLGKSPCSLCCMATCLIHTGGGEGPCQGVKACTWLYIYWIFFAWLAAGPMTSKHPGTPRVCLLLQSDAKMNWNEICLLVEDLERIFHAHGFPDGSTLFHARMPSQSCSRLLSTGVCTQLPLAICHALNGIWINIFCKPNDHCSVQLMLCT